MSAAQKWDQRYRDITAPGAPSWVLTHNQHLLPEHGNALDLACGASGNGLSLAQQGLTTSVWDISAMALKLQLQWALEQKITLQTLQRDCEKLPPEPASFDVICVAHFLHRPSCANLSRALKPGGVLFYQTFCANKLADSGPSRDDHLLQESELLSLFSDLKIRFYREDDRCGDLDQGERNRAFLVAQKPQ
ncbi:class I SAM-dependent methyltransferase [Halieaceae bacterium IMCC14734]|uniref:Class I SAM-dependent methyltransferase n=1 Tax=Candidatus Litorirhabdus singularis TaxID=2518993 RepID=A0ABT3TDQ2_9GAMM|nr:class I SAM-dependent methyltransferase [Candidatus Litorirhabdus singularis]MCX2979955.1 class I SAM-dependent methyltransferase [Candidatus Litorirhabdus singularis]